MRTNMAVGGFENIQNSVRFYCIYSNILHSIIAFDRVSRARTLSLIRPAPASARAMSTSLWWEWSANNCDTTPRRASLWPGWFFPPHQQHTSLVRSSLCTAKMMSGNYVTTALGWPVVFRDSESQIDQANINHTHTNAMCDCGLFQKNTNKEYVYHMTCTCVWIVARNKHRKHTIRREIYGADVWVFHATPLTAAQQIAAAAEKRIYSMLHAKAITVGFACCALHAFRARHIRETHITLAYTTPHGTLFRASKRIAARRRAGCGCVSHQRDAFSARQLLTHKIYGGFVSSDVACCTEREREMELCLHCGPREIGGHFAVAKAFCVSFVLKILLSSFIFSFNINCRLWCREIGLENRDSVREYVSLMNRKSQSQILNTILKKTYIPVSIFLATKCFVIGFIKLLCIQFYKKESICFSSISVYIV